MLRVCSLAPRGRSRGRDPGHSPRKHYKRARLSGTLPTYVTPIPTQFAEDRNFWSHNGFSTFFVFAPTEHARSSEGANPPVSLALVLSKNPARQTLCLRS